MKRWKTITGLLLIIVLALSVLFLKAPLYYKARSYAVMYVYSKYEAKNSLLQKQNISLTIPGGSSTEQKDWYPFVMIFNDDQGFSRYMGRELALTILYNFGAFNGNRSSSDFFLEESPYYNSFYGGYIVRNESGDKKYGFTEGGELEISEVLAVPEYDFKYLVLESLGCPKDKLTMEIRSFDTSKDVKYAGYNGWSQIDALLLTNSPDHNYKGERRAYIQYGNPHKKEGREEFKVMTSHGRIYVRYFEEFASTVFLYIISPNILTLEKCDEDILSKSIINKLKV